MIEHKGYGVQPHERMPQAYRISYLGKGGKIPDVLQGGFTSRGIAIQAIDLYLKSKEA